ncbi:MAG: hydrolase [Treponemataceae bacterium]
MSEEKECCPKFDPLPWDGKKNEWKEKPFLMRTIPQLFHMPLPWIYGKAITEMWERAQKLNIAPPIKDFLLLAYDPSPWKSELYLSVTGEHPDAGNIVKISGTFMSKVFDGPYQDVPKYIKALEAFVRSEGKTPKKYYFYFTTCPKCAKKYGHNYIVAFAEV